MAVADKIFLDNDYFSEVGPVTYQDLADGLEKNRTGWTDLKMKLCLTADHAAAPIHSSLDATLQEQGATAIYRGGFEGANLSQHLEASLDTVIYLHVYRQQDYHVVSPVTPSNREVA